jgi:uncharacterized protein
VNDLADVLPADREARLEERLAAFERETSHQIVLLTVPSLEGDPIEDFSIRVGERWRIGHAGLDNGIIVIVAPKDRQARVEVGYGLEGVVPDAIASRVLRDRMLPEFREGRMADGIEAGLDALIAAARGEAIPEERRPRPRAAPGPSDFDRWLPSVLFCALLGSLFALPLRRRSPVLGAGLAGIMGGGLAYVLLASLLAAGEIGSGRDTATGRASVLIVSLLAAGCASLLAVVLALQHPVVLRPRRDRFGRWDDYGGGFGGGFGGGSGGSDGGFSGGGGGFGGGGASGRW